MSVPQDNNEIEIEFQLSANYKLNSGDHKNITLEYTLENAKEIIETEDGNYKIPLTIFLKKPMRKKLGSEESQFSTKIQREYGDINLKARMQSTKHVDFNSNAEFLHPVHDVCSKDTIASLVSHVSRTHSNAPSIITIKPSCFHNFESMLDTSANYFNTVMEADDDEIDNILKPVKFTYKIPLDPETGADLNILYSRNVLAYPNETVLERINNLLEVRLKPFQDTINEIKQAVYEILANTKKV